MRADTRKLRALLQLLRACGVAEYTDGPVTVKFAPPEPKASEPEKLPKAEQVDPREAHNRRLREGLFNSSGDLA